MSLQNMIAALSCTYMLVLVYFVLNILINYILKEECVNVKLLRTVKRFPSQQMSVEANHHTAASASNINLRGMVLEVIKTFLSLHGGGLCENLLMCSFVNGMFLTDLCINT